MAEYITLVCKECHEKDRNVTKCHLEFEHHSAYATSYCDICGKERNTCFCRKYLIMREIRIRAASRNSTDRRLVV